MERRGQLNDRNIRCLSRIRKIIIRRFANSHIHKPNKCVIHNVGQVGLICVKPLYKIVPQVDTRTVTWPIGLKHCQQSKMSTVSCG